MGGTDFRARKRGGLFMVVLFAIVMRMGFATQTVVYHADEVWQYIEPSYGLITGRWIRPWEYIDGIRGWFVPVLLVPFQALGLWLSPEGQLHLLLVRLFLAILSLGVPLAFYDLARPFGQRHGIIAAWVGAIWPDIFYFGSRASGEGIAMSLLFPAIALCARARREFRPAYAFSAGVLLALGAVVRFQYLPAIGLIALWACWPRHGRCALWLAAGGAAGLLAGGLADILAGQAPYLWMWRNFTINLTEGRSEFFGTEPPWKYIVFLLENWWLASAAVVPLAIVGARRLPTIALMAVLVIAIHSAIPHKEYRFILLGANALVLLAAIGSVDAADWFSARFRISERVSRASLQAAWFVLAVVMSLGPVFVENWGRATIHFQTLAMAGAEPGACGIASYELHYHPALAHAFVNRPIQTVLLDGPHAAQQAAANQSSFNVAIASRLKGAELPPSFRLDTCHRQMGRPPESQYLCVFVRDGGCEPDPGDFDYQTALSRRGY